MSVLITGGTGFIGSHTVVELIQTGKEVVIVDNLSNSDVTTLDKIEKITGTRPAFYEGDIRDRAILDKIFTENTIDAVIHFAGLKAVGESVEKPVEYYDNNVAGTVSLLKVMAKHDCYKMVFSSSATVYGMNNEAPFSEDMPLSTINPYGATKLMIEDILRDLKGTGKPYAIAILRYFNPIGAHESGLIGEDPKGIPNNLLPYIAKVATGELKELSVFGDDYPTCDGTGVRDYIHVVDLARGHLKALDYVMKAEGIDAFNLGTGNGFSVLQLLHAFEEASGKTVAYKITGRRQGDIASCYASTEKAKNILGWAAEKNVEDMCEDAWRFVSNTTV